MTEIEIGEKAGIGDTVYLIDKKTQLPISTEFTVLGIAHRSGPDNLMKKYLYLSDGNGAYTTDEVRVVYTKENSQENESEQGEERV